MTLSVAETVVALCIVHCVAFGAPTMCSSAVKRCPAIKCNHKCLLMMQEKKTFLETVFHRISFVVFNFSCLGAIRPVKRAHAILAACRGRIVQEGSIAFEYLYTSGMPCICLCCKVWCRPLRVL